MRKRGDSALGCCWTWWPRMTPEAKLGLTYIVESSLSPVGAQIRVFAALCIFIFGRDEVDVRRIGGGQNDCRR